MTKRIEEQQEEQEEVNELVAEIRKKTPYEIDDSAQKRHFTHPSLNTASTTPYEKPLIPRHPPRRDSKHHQPCDS